MWQHPSQHRRSMRWQIAKVASNVSIKLKNSCRAAPYGMLINIGQVLHSVGQAWQVKQVNHENGLQKANRPEETFVHEAFRAFLLAKLVTRKQLEQLWDVLGVTNWRLVVEKEQQNLQQLTLKPENKLIWIIWYLCTNFSETASNFKLSCFTWDWSE